MCFSKTTILMMFFTMNITSNTTPTVVNFVPGVDFKNHPLGIKYFNIVSSVVQTQPLIFSLY